MRTIVVICICLWSWIMKAATPQYEKRDSVWVVDMLREAGKADGNENWVLFFARKFIGVPYIAKTLEKNNEERLVVNLRELDCTTFVENVLALTLCAKNGKKTFEDFCRYLRLVRYRKGKIAYTARLHYFSEWIADNSKQGFVSEIQSPDPPFTRVQTLKIDYMSKHPEKYPMLVKNPSWLKPIKRMENELNGKRYRYIPKTEIAATRVFRDAIADGNIVAIITRQEGLDTSHVGFAVWHKDGLHLLHASSLHKKVVEDPKTMYDYMQRQRMQQGIRVVRVE